MRIAKQISVFMVNQPGRLANVCTALAKSKINISAMTVTDSTEHGVLRMIVNETAAAKKVVEGLGCPVTETDVLQMELSNHPGAFASVAERLAQAHINIDYAYCTAGAPGGKTTAVFKVPFLQKAMEVLEQAIARKTEREMPLHRAGASKR